MSSANKKNSTKKVYVITYKELFFTIFIFIVILFALYPKDLLKQQIISEKANYDLSMLYLRNLLKHNPEDESLMLILASQSLKAGNKDLALRLLGLLLHSEDKKIRQQATVLSFDLEKERYFYMKDKERKQDQLLKLKKLFNMIYFAKMYDPKDVKKWYQNALFVGASYPAYQFLKEVLAQEPDNITLIKDAFYLSSQYGDKTEAYKYVKYLQEHDKGNLEKWVIEEYYLDMRYRKYAQAEKLLLAHRGEGTKIEAILGDFYLYRKKYHKASKIYLSLYQSTDDFKQKKYYFKKALESLIASKNTTKVTQLIEKHQALFLNDPDMIQFMLKTYLANGKVGNAAVLSKKILRFKYKK